MTATEFGKKAPPRWRMIIDAAVAVIQVCLT
jgi:hypothetical protein